jgi:hypothetical protein
VSDINILALAKGEERYIFLYNDETRGETLRMMGRYASNSDLSFSWYDAAVMSQKIRQHRKCGANDTLSVASNRFHHWAVEDLLSGEEPIVD